MKRQRQQMSLAAMLALVWLAAAPLAAGVVYEIEVTDHEQSPPKTQSIETAAEGRNLKMGIASKAEGSQGEMIFRGDRREMVVVDHDSESYTVIDEEAIGQIAGQVNSAMAQMQEALKNVPEDRRAMVEQMMKQRMPAENTLQREDASVLENTGERGKQAGYPCVRYVVLRDGHKVRELWVTDWDHIEGGRDVVGAFEEMAAFFGELMEAIPNMGGQGSESLDETIYRYMEELDGFPVVTREFGDDGSLEGESTLRSARRRTLDPAAFEPPSGYKRRSMLGVQ